VLRVAVAFLVPGSTATFTDGPPHEPSTEANVT
jgi:hypothetical protein